MMKRKTLMWMLAAILCCGLTTGLTACSTNDDNPSGQTTEGLWISYEEKVGTVTDEKLEYDQIARVIQLNSDGTGFVERFYLLGGIFVWGDQERYDEDWTLTYTIAHGMVSYTTKGGQTGTLLIEGDMLTDQDGHTYEQADELTALITEEWASDVHGGNDIHTIGYMVRGNDVKEDKYGEFIVEGNPSDVQFYSFSSRIKHNNFRLRHGGNMELRYACITTEDEQYPDAPAVNVEGDEPLTLSLTGCIQMITKGEYAIVAKGGVKLKGNGELRVLNNRKDKYGISTVKTDEDAVQLAAEGYELSFKIFMDEFANREMAIYTVRPKESVALSEVKAEHVGYVIASDGRVYPTRQAAVAKGVEPLAMIAYVNAGGGHGMAVAIQKASIPIEDFAKAHPLEGCTWMLPSRAEVLKMLDGCAGFNGDEKAVERGKYQGVNMYDAQVYANDGDDLKAPRNLMTSEAGARKGSRVFYSTVASRFLTLSVSSSVSYPPCLAF